MPRFGDLESAIMEQMWAADAPLKVRQVLEQLAPKRELAYTTVQTVMDILARKGWLERSRDGRANTYRPTAAREDYVAGLLSEALAETDDRPAAVLRLVQTLKPSEADQLGELLGEVKTARRRRR